MESQDSEILQDFQVESKKLLTDMAKVLEEAEGNIQQARSLEDYGLYVDRIMGGAKSIAMNFPDQTHIIHKIADYSEVCKAVGYKTSQVWDNEPFYDICIALLMDATDALGDMIENMLQAPQTDVRQLINKHLIDRLKWVSAKFGAEYRSTVAIDKKTKMSQGDIDGLLKKLGVE